MPVIIQNYKNYPIHFYNRLISANDLFRVFSIPEAKREFDQVIKRCGNRTFGNYKIFTIQQPNGDLQDKIFINLNQTLLCLRHFVFQQFITQEQSTEFSLWYSGNVEQALEILFSDGQEERIQNQLILLSSYGNIKLIKEFTVPDFSDSQYQTRRYDIIQFINRTNTVRIRELKSHKINLRDIEITLLEKRYLDLATCQWPNKNIELIFSSLEGIEDNAQLFIDTIDNVSFENVQDFGLHLYLSALKKTPLEGWTFFKQDVAPKFAEVLPPRNILMAAEDNLKNSL